MCVACVWAPFDCPVPLCELRCLCPYKLYSLTVQTDTLTSFLKKITLNIVHITRLFGCLDQDIFRKHPPFTTGCWYLTNHNTALCVCKKPTFTFSTSSSVFLDTSKVCIKHTKKIGLARTVYVRCLWPSRSQCHSIRYNPCKKHRIYRVGQNRLYTPYMTVFLWFPTQKVRIYTVYRTALGCFASN